MKCKECEKEVLQLRRGMCITCYRKNTGFSQNKLQSERDWRELEILNLQREIQVLNKIIVRVRKDNEQLKCLFMREKYRRLHNEL